MCEGVRSPGTGATESHNERSSGLCPSSGEDRPTLSRTDCSVSVSNALKATASTEGNLRCPRAVPSSCACRGCYILTCTKPSGFPFSPPEHNLRVWSESDQQPGPRLPRRPDPCRVQILRQLCPGPRSDPNPGDGALTPGHQVVGFKRVTRAACGLHLSAAVTRKHPSMRSSPDRCSSVGGALCHQAAGSQLPVPGQGTRLACRFGSRAGHEQEVTGRCFSLTSTFLSLSPSLPLSKNNKIFSKDEERQLLSGFP